MGHEFTARLPKSSLSWIKMASYQIVCLIFRLILLGLRSFLTTDQHPVTTSAKSITLIHRDVIIHGWYHPQPSTYGLFIMGKPPVTCGYTTATNMPTSTPRRSHVESSWLCKEGVFASTSFNCFFWFGWSRWSWWKNMFLLLGTDFVAKLWIDGHEQDHFASVAIFIH